MHYTDQEKAIKSGFDASRKLLAALGDETRQAIIATLMERGGEAGAEGGDCGAMRVGEITERTHLSRPAVSHHLKILLDADVIGVYGVGTKNFYHMKLGGAWPRFVALVNDIERLRAESEGYHEN